MKVIREIKDKNTTGVFVLVDHKKYGQVNGLEIMITKVKDNNIIEQIPDTMIETLIVQIEKTLNMHIERTEAMKRIKNG